MSSTNSNTLYQCSLNTSNQALTPGTTPGFSINGTASIGDAQVLAIAEALKQAFVDNGFTDATVIVTKDVLNSVSSQADFTKTPPAFI